MDSDRFRFFFAYLALFTFVVSSTVGFFMLETWAGFVALGVSSCIAALLLGTDY
jgi:hypothetical protein